jgi:hypothetical protein
MVVAAGNGKAGNSSPSAAAANLILKFFMVGERKMARRILAWREDTYHKER